MIHEYMLVTVSILYWPLGFKSITCGDFQEKLAFGLYHMFPGSVRSNHQAASPSISRPLWVVPHSCIERNRPIFFVHPWTHEQHLRGLIQGKNHGFWGVPGTANRGHSKHQLVQPIYDWSSEYRTKLGMIKVVLRRLEGCHCCRTNRGPP